MTSALLTQGITLVGFVLVSLMRNPVCTNADTNDPLVNTTHGTVKGTKSLVTSQQIQVDKFLGIPYAEPPVGERRFKKPVPANQWSGTRNATEMSSACYQLAFPTGFRGADVWLPANPVSEDCLYLNIWVPRNPQRAMANLTTMVWIHGGGFVYGSADSAMYDGAFLAATQNVIVASMNYRLGPLGFLFFGTPDAPGNMGLMDQQLALKWVYQNIESFGGDPQKISIFGESAGGVSVSYHLLAPESWDYFQFAIMESGTALSPWGFQSREDSVDNSKSYAKAVNCSSHDTDEILKCLNAKATQELINVESLAIGYTPTNDGEFIDRPVEELIREKRFKRCNIVVGYNTNEQTILMSYYAPLKFGRNLPEPSLTRSEIKEYINRIAYAPVKPLPNNSFAFDSALYVYLDSVPPKIRGSNVDVLSDLVGDYEYKCGIIQLAEIYSAEDIGVFLYHFDHRSSDNPWPRWMGVNHGSEIDYIFGHAIKETSIGDVRVRDAMMSYWATFASTGNPNAMSSATNHSIWSNFTTVDQHYKVLKVNPKESYQYPRYRECSFWRDFKPTIEKYIAETTCQTASQSAHHTPTRVFITLICLFYPILTTPSTQ